MWKKRRREEIHMNVRQKCGKCRLKEKQARRFVREVSAGYRNVVVEEKCVLENYSKFSRNPHRSLNKRGYSSRVQSEKFWRDFYAVSIHDFRGAKERGCETLLSRKSSRANYTASVLFTWNPCVSWMLDALCARVRSAAVHPQLAIARKIIRIHNNLYPRSLYTLCILPE